MRNVVKGITLSVGMWLLVGCNILSILPPPVAPLNPRPLVVATATPTAGQLHVTQAYTATHFAQPTTSSAVTLARPLDLHLEAKPSGVFVAVVVEMRNTGNTPLELAQAEFTLIDAAGHSYPRAPQAELTLRLRSGPALTLADTAPLSDRVVPSGGQATGYLVFDVIPAYVLPLHLTARIPGSPSLTSIPFILEGN